MYSRVSVQASSLAFFALETVNKSSATISELIISSSCFSKSQFVQKRHRKSADGPTRSYTEWGC